jgi:hypothetical protein
MAVSHEQRLDLTRFGLVIGGIGLLGYGAWLHYPPLGYVTGGAALLVVVLIGLWRSR